MFKYLFAVAMALISCGDIAIGQEEIGRVTFAPENDFGRYDNAEVKSLVTQAEFDRILDDAFEIYAPIVQKQGGTLIIGRSWDDPTVNAFASRQGRSWVVQFFGGLARRPEITRGGFTLVVCHEIGHHLGGFPRYQGQWASVEGQSDLYATAECAKLLLKTADQTPNLSPVADEWCDYAHPNDKYGCMAMMHASQSTANLLAVLEGKLMPALETPDQTRVLKTLQTHPNAQCRLDTLFSGVLCYDDIKNCIRPRCWFK